jgi:YcxB-like protein
MLEIRGSFTWRDSLRIFFLASRPRRGWAIVGLLLCLLGATVLGLSWRDYLRDGSGSPGGLTFACLVLIFLFGVYYPWVHFRSFRRSKTLSLPVTISLTDEAILVSNEFSSATLPWSLIVGVRSNRHLYLLYDAIHPLVAIPKRFVASASELDHLHSVLRDHHLVV